MKNDNNYLKYNLEDIDLSEFENIENAEIEDRSIKIEDKRRRQKKIIEAHVRFKVHRANNRKSKISI